MLTVYFLYLVISSTIVTIFSAAFCSKNCAVDGHGSVHRDTITKITNRMHYID